jgi:hypothetical protein
VQKGTLPIIVSVPHGGTREVPGVPERRGAGVAKFVTVRDANTSELAEAFAAALEEKLDGKPWMVVARFDTSCALGQPRGEKAPSRVACWRLADLAVFTAGLVRSE